MCGIIAQVLKESQYFTIQKEETLRSQKTLPQGDGDGGVIPSRQTIIP